MQVGVLMKLTDLFYTFFKCVLKGCIALPALLNLKHISRQVQGIWTTGRDELPVSKICHTD